MRIGVEIVPFDETGPVPAEVDLIWEPGLLGNRTPPSIFRGGGKPLVATVHGASGFTMRWREIYSNPLKGYRAMPRNRRTLNAWRWFKKRVSAVIAVSEFGGREVSSVFGIPDELVHPVHHGVDHSVFQPEGEKASLEHPYLFQVAQYQPLKNVDRVLTAYKSLPKSRRPPLVMVLPGYQGRIDVEGVTLIREGLNSEELAEWYRGALGCVVPSLRESFNMPILEAMACGCPVITSNVSACPEVAGEAALLVDPRSSYEIGDSMRRLIEDESLRKILSQKGLERAREFTWRKSAEGHLKVFQRVLGER